MTLFGTWLDFVHQTGIVGGLLTLGALAVGLTIALRKGGGALKRMRLRTWHMLLGVSAAIVALGHAAGRAAQAGELALSLDTAHLATVAFVLLLATGVVRFRPPRLLEGRCWRGCTGQPLSRQRCCCCCTRATN